MSDNDTPIDPREEAQPFSAQVIDLGGVRIQWGLSRRIGQKKCEHLSMVYSAEEQRVWCKDCSRTIENFQAFMVIVNRFEGMIRAAKSKLEKAEAAMMATARLRATKELDRIWSSKGPGMVPCCPHCMGGLLPDDFADGIKAARTREMELARRARK